MTDAADLMHLVDGTPTARKLERDQVTVGQVHQAPSQRAASRGL
ncbi:MAG: hypothetical protein QM713_00160 [Arachnia sp.]